jgi:purine-nucleoside phosphorylase
MTLAKDRLGTVPLSLDRLRESAAAIRRVTKLQPKVGFILGTGLSVIADLIDVEASISYADIPHFHPTTIPSHPGEMVFGCLGKVPTVAMKGRYHFYEGHSMKVVAYPVEVMKRLGVQTLIVTNASGGVNPQYAEGDLVVITDHINLYWHNPLVGPNDEEEGPRFVDMLDAYSPRLVELAEKVAARHNIPLPRGVFAFVAGPNFETPAELRFLAQNGVDVIGWSLLPEVIMARHRDLEVLAFSCISDLSVADTLRPVNLERLIENAQRAAGKLAVIVREVVAELYPGSTC